MGDADLCENWEEFSDDAERLEKELAKLHTGKSIDKSRLNAGDLSQSQPLSNDVPPPTSIPQFRILRRNQDPITSGTFVSPGIQLDSTTEDSFRTQFVPQLKILTRPKSSVPDPHKTIPKDKKQGTTNKSFEQREKEYSEARMRILGDVRFVEEEKEAALESIMTPAEILKMKVTRAVMGDGVPLPTLPGPRNDPPPKTSSDLCPTPQESTISDTGDEETGISKCKNRRKGRTRPNPPPLHFPPSKIDSERIVRQPRGPDGTTGFHLPR